MYEFIYDFFLIQTFPFISQYFNQFFSFYINSYFLIKESTTNSFINFNNITFINLINYIEKNINNLLIFFIIKIF